MKVWKSNGNSSKASNHCLLYHPIVFQTDEGNFSTVKSLLGSDSVHKVYPSELPIQPINVWSVVNLKKNPTGYSRS
jgi:hypothetical protein